jgi:2-oxoglutarate ferredoxin oxidoreductase subunit alpha
MIFTWKIGAEAGAGVMIIGRTLAKCFTRGGLSVVGYPEYPSLVRGGQNTYQVCVSDRQINAPRKTSDVIVALNKAAVFFHKDFITKNGALIYDSEIDISGFKIRDDIALYPIPLSKIITELSADQRMKNTITLGATLALIDYPFDFLSSVITDEFKRKGDEVVQKNIAVAKAGYDYVKSNFKEKKFKISIKPLSTTRKILLTGNEALALGAIKAGLKLFAAYPMTPASSILHYIAEKEYEYNIVVKHTEDEISAIQYAIGAAYAGVRAATCTSGGGFSLMVESIGMAGESETPVVVFLAQRVGPSTGMPTWTEQGDLRFALHCSQGDFLRVILAPGDVSEAFYLSAKAFNIAEKYQLPVIVLSDKFLSETHFSAERFDDKSIKIERGKIATNLPQLQPMERFKRYVLSDDGVSSRTLPGEPNGMHVTSTYEHNEYGFSTENFIERRAQMDKRMSKIRALEKDIDLPLIYGKKDADVSLIAWGSQKLPCLDALRLLEENGINANLIHFTHLFPLYADAIKKVFAGTKRTVMVENNYSAQFAGMLKEYCDIAVDFTMVKYDARQFFPEQIAEEIISLKKRGFKGPRRIVVGEKEDHDYYYVARYNL